VYWYNTDNGFVENTGRKIRMSVCKTGGGKETEDFMLDFVAYIPTTYIFGRGTEEQAGQRMRALGCHRVLLHYGGGSVEKSGLLARVTASLDEAGVSYVLDGGVQPNPVLSKVRDSIACVRENDCDGILAVGGGSVLDSAKAVGIGALYEGDVWDFFCGKAQPKSCMPIGSVLTLPAAGSEGSGCAVITNEQTMQKSDPVFPVMRVQFCIMNPELTFTLPAYQTAAGATDMFSHVLERYFTNTPVVLMNRLAEQTLKAILQVAPAVLAQPQNYDLRAELMWIGTVAHNNTCGYGEEQDWASHNIEHALSGVYDVTHGAGLAIITPAWMKHIYKRKLDKFVEYAVNVFDVKTKERTKEEIAMEGIARTEAFFRSLGMPTRLGQIDVDESRFEEMVRLVCPNEDSITGHFVPLDRQDVRQIYTLAL
jgi:alcohol dehydrogenase YqhD (iron-dependent ADH family)